MNSHWTALNTTEFSYQIWSWPIFLLKPKRADWLMCFRLLRWIFMSLFWLVCRNLMGSYEFVLWWCGMLRILQRNLRQCSAQTKQAAYYIDFLNMLWVHPYYLKVCQKTRNSSKATCYDLWLWRIGDTNCTTRYGDALINWRLLDGNCEGSRKLYRLYTKAPSPIARALYRCLVVGPGEAFEWQDGVSGSSMDSKKHPEYVFPELKIASLNKYSSGIWHPKKVFSFF